MVNWFLVESNLRELSFDIRIREGRKKSQICLIMSLKRRQASLHRPGRVRSRLWLVPLKLQYLFRTPDLLQQVLHDISLYLTYIQYTFYLDNNLKKVMQIYIASNNFSPSLIWFVLLNFKFEKNMKDLL